MDTSEDAGGGTMLVNADDGLGTTVGTATDSVEIDTMAELTGGETETTTLLGIGESGLGTP